MRRRTLHLLVTALLGGSIAAGCQASYVLRQAAGQLGAQRSSVPLSTPDMAGAVGAAAALKLQWVPRILTFAREELGLDPGTAYRSYLDTGEAPVSHAVTASHPLALIPMQWRFPFAGRVPYKAFFDRAAAEEEAARLRELGLEALILPVGAYSTLGWFDDPVLSTMLRGNIADLVDVLLHETTHRTVYIPGHSSFNESLATFVARDGTSRFLAAHPELQSELPGYLEEREEERRREQIYVRLRNDLDSLYRSPLDDGRKAARKAEILASAGEALRLLSPAGGPARQLTNAHVLSFTCYHELVPLLGRLTEKLGGRTADLVKYAGSIASEPDPVETIRQKLGEEDPLTRRP